MLLALDTTSSPGSLALLLADGTCHEQPGDARPFGEQLPAAVLALVESAGRQLDAVDVFAVATGPGSLTGLRVGIATVQGLAFATGRPCVGVPVFEALAWHWLDTAHPAPGDVLGVWLDARRDEVFTSLVRRTTAPCDAEATMGDLVAIVDAPAVGHAPETVERWRPMLAGDAARVTICGTRVQADRERFATLPGTLVAVVEPPACLARAVAVVAAREVRRGRTVAPHALHPLYVRRPDVETARHRAQAPQQP